MNSNSVQSPEQHSATVRERLVSLLTRRYPLCSGCGTLSNSRFVDVLAGRRNANIWTRVFGADVLVPIDDLVGRAMFFTGDLDPKVTWAIRKYCRPGDVTFDVGANLGLVSLLLAKLVGASGSVHSFEPNPHILSFLKTTVSANPHLNIEVHPFALGSANETLDLTITKGNAGSASFKSVGDLEVEKTVEVKVKRLSEFCESQNIERINFMKMDVEGFESEVLEGAREFFERTQPRAILFEENEDRSNAEEPRSFQTLRSMGYTIQAIPRTIFRAQIVPLEHPNAQSAHDFLAISSEEQGS